MMTNTGSSVQQLWECPYNKSHVVSKEKIQMHLVKCRRYNGTNLNLVDCPFDTTHKIPKPELSYHLQSCPSRTAFDEHTSEAIPKYPVAEPVVNAEFWDDEDVPAYDPQEHCKNNLILRNAAIYTKANSEKLKFRGDERSRVQKLFSDKYQNASQVPTQEKHPTKENGNIGNLEKSPENDCFDLLVKQNEDISAIQNCKDEFPNFEEMEENETSTEDFKEVKRRRRRRGRGHGKQQM